MYDHISHVASLKALGFWSKYCSFYRKRLFTLRLGCFISGPKAKAVKSNAILQRGVRFSPFSHSAKHPVCSLEIGFSR